MGLMKQWSVRLSTTVFLWRMRTLIILLTIQVRNITINFRFKKLL